MSETKNRPRDRPTDEQDQAAVNDESDTGVVEFFCTVIETDEGQTYHKKKIGTHHQPLGPGFEVVILFRKESRDGEYRCIAQRENGEKHVEQTFF